MVNIKKELRNCRLSKGGIVIAQNLIITIFQGVYRVYSKAAGAVTCPAASQVVTEQECRLAGELVGHPFNKAVTDATGRPGGCFWDQNGHSYFNTVLDGASTWGGVGGICGKKYVKIKFKKT